MTAVQHPTDPQPRADIGHDDAIAIHDVLIVGGGPAGAAAAVYASRSGLRTLVVDKGTQAGALGMSRKIANYPGIEGEVSGAEVIDRIRRQAEGFGASFVSDKITATQLDGGIKSAWGAKDAYQARAMIIATGSMGRSRSLPGEERLAGRGVSYCATCDGYFFRGQTVAVAGATDESAEEALFLARFAERVHLLVPTEELRSPSDLLAALDASPSIQIHRSTVLQEIVGSDTVEAVRFRTRGGPAATLPVSGVFVYLQGGRPIVDFLAGALPLSEEGCLRVDPFFQTAIPGVFAAGDVLCKHLKQAVIAAAEGAAAAVAADRYLSGREKLRPDWA